MNCKKPDENIVAIYYGEQKVYSNTNMAKQVGLKNKKSKGKKDCAICGKKCGFFDFKTSDGGWVCKDCSDKIRKEYDKVDIYRPLPSDFIVKNSIDSNEIVKIYNNPSLASKYVPQYRMYDIPKTYRMGNATFDDSNEVINFDFALDSSMNSAPLTCPYSKIVKYEYRENEDTIATGGSGLGRAVVGGVLFGGAGAVVGAVTKKKSSTTIISDMYILITFSNANNSSFYTQKIKLNKKGESFKQGSGMYLHYLSQAEDILAKLDRICDNDNNKIEIKETANTKSESLSSADEIRKFKELLDDGIITQEEFDAKKKQLLGI